VIWTPEELAAELSKVSGLDADGLAARVLDLALGEGYGEPRDDIAVVAIKLPAR
jgi:hypothetical protein